MTSTIYGLVDPRNNQLRYIGQSVNPAGRLFDHLKRSAIRGATHRTRWLRSLLAVGLRPEQIELEVVPRDESDEAESFWIAYFRYIGASLTNHGAGGHVGGQIVGFRHSEDTKAKLRAFMLGKPSPRGTGWRTSPETIEKIRIAKTGVPLSDDHRAHIAAGRLGKKFGPYKKRGQ